MYCIFKFCLGDICIFHSQIPNNEVISEWKGNIEKNVFIECGFPCGTRLMGTLCIHLMIYSPEYSVKDALYRYENFFIMLYHNSKLCNHILHEVRKQLVTSTIWSKWLFQDLCSVEQLFP